MQSILTDYTTAHSPKRKKKENRDRVTVATISRVVFPLHPHVSDILYCLLLGPSTDRPTHAAVVMS